MLKIMHTGALFLLVGRKLHYIMIDGRALQGFIIHIKYQRMR